MMGRAVGQLVRRRARRPHRPQLRLPGGQGDPAGRGSGGAGQAGAAAGDRPRRRHGGRRRTASRSRRSSAWACDDNLLTHLRAGTVCEDEGVADIAMHARTAQQHYAGDARWDAIGELKAHVTTIPVLGNGDVWVAADAAGDDAGDRLRRRRRRPRLPRPAVAVRRPARRVRRPPGAAAAAARRRRRRDGRPRHRPRRAPRLRAHGDARLPQAHGVVPHRLPRRRRGAAPAGAWCRRSSSSTTCWPTLDRRPRPWSPAASRIRRGHTNGPIRVALPDGYLDDELAVPDDADVLTLSGG